MAEIVMPRLSDSMEEGTIIRWLVEDGAQVARGQEIVEIETDKATMTYEADDAGTLHLVAGEGDTLPIGAVIATVGDAPAPAGGGNGSGDGLASAPSAPAAAPAPAEAPAEAAPAGPADATPPATPAAPAEAVPAGPADAADDDGDPSTSPAGAIAGRTKASPVARRLAREHGIGLDKLTGTGPSGRIVKADVLAAAEQAPAIMAEVRPETSTGPAAAPTPPPRTPPPVPVGAPPAPVGAPAQPVSGKGDVQVVELSRLQQVVARRMAEAKATIPEFTLTIDVDMHDAVALRDQLKTLASAGTVVPSYNDMIVKATALALRQHPRANGSYKDGRFELYSRINVGVAVAATDALVVPTIFDADHKTLTDIATTTRTLAARVRENAITPPELSGATFTVSNLGMYGITHFTAVINPPQAGILAVGALEQRPVSRDGDIVSRPMLTLTLTSDHRILYGADAAVFLGAIKRNLEHPLTLAL